MEYLSGYSDDFLCTGIYQMYCNEPDLRPEWSEYEALLGQNDETTAILELPFYDSANHFNGSPSEPACDWTTAAMPDDFGSTTASSTICKTSAAPVYYNPDLAASSSASWSSSSSTSSSSIDDAELLLLDDNIESFLLDLDNIDTTGAAAPSSCIDDWSAAFAGPTHDAAPTGFGLPERTFFCNDSCDAFLLESSAQLELSLSSAAAAATATAAPVTEHYGNGDDPMQPLDDTTFREADAVADSASPASTTTIVPVCCYPCTFSDCAKVYAKPAHLKAHLRRHVGDKPYVCTWRNCVWRFSRSDELSRHRRSHSGVKPYKCVYCTKCFARSDHLTKHRKVHERKMAKQQQRLGTTEGCVVFVPLPPGRPGRRPKALVAAAEAAAAAAAAEAAEVVIGL